MRSTAEALLIRGAWLFTQALDSSHGPIPASRKAALTEEIEAWKLAVRNLTGSDPAFRQVACKDCQHRRWSSKEGDWATGRPFCVIDLQKHDCIVKNQNLDCPDFAPTAPAKSLDTKPLFDDLAIKPGTALCPLQDGQGCISFTSNGTGGCLAQLEIPRYHKAQICSKAISRALAVTEAIANATDDCCGIHFYKTVVDVLQANHCLPKEP